MIGSGILFVVFSALVRIPAVTDAEGKVLLAIHSMTTKGFERAMLNLNAIGGPKPIYAFAMCLAAYWLQKRRPDLTAFVVVGCGLSGGLNLALRAAFHRHRPELWHTLIYDHSFVWSFPSGHSCLVATISSAVLIPMAASRTKTIATAIACAYCFVVAATTLVLGVHYPIDILAGWLSGWIVIYATWLAITLKSKHVETEP